MRQKIGGAALGLGLAALGVDRWVIGHGPATASAVEHYAAPASAIRPCPPPQADTACEAGDVLSDRLQQAAAAGGLHPDADAAPADASDPFRPSPLWFPPPAVTLEADRAAGFRSRHRLTAILTGSRAGGGLAIIDGKTLAPGQALDGFTLIALRERSAVFGAGPTTVELLVGPALGR